jgi:hypothetical protein
VPPPTSLLAPTSLVAGPARAVPQDRFYGEDGISGDWSGVRTLAEFERAAAEKIQGFTVGVAGGTGWCSQLVKSRHIILDV